MPLEFSLALHISTMSSGLVKEMITNENLQTQVFIKLLKLTCALNFKITLENGREITIPYNSPNGEQPEDFIEKIKNNEKLEDDDLSIRSLVLASQQMMNTYMLPEEDIIDGNYIGISRHIETLDAILGSNNFVVRSKNELQDEYVNPDHVLLVYQMDDLTDSGTDNGREFLGKYSIATGAYVCSLDSQGYVDETSGKLGATFYTDDQEGSYINNYSLYYKFVEEDENGYRYQVFTREIGSDEEICMYGDQFVPKKDNAYIIFDNGNMYFNVVSGLGNFRNSDGMDIEVKLRRMASDQKDAYMAMFKEIDWFMTVLTYSKMYAENPPSNYGYESAYGGDSGDPNSYLCYAVQFDEICDLVNEGDFEQAKDVFNDMMNRIQNDCDYLHNIANNTKSSYKKKINRALKDAGYEGLDIDTLEEIVEIFTGTKDVNNGEVDFAQPYITEVTRHWFKDVVFDGNDEFETIYERSTDTFSIPYTGEELNSKIQVEAILDPIDPEDENYYYIQPDDEQPYVIKGDTVYKDGKKIMDIDEKDRIKSTEDEDYYYGDGYRTTKKLFTQGQYYVFDGSAETARSIFWQQQLEEMPNGTTVRVTVKNGRIYHVSGNYIEEGDTVVESTQNGSTEENGVPVIYENHILTINDLQYLSPTEYDLDKVNERVKHINETWESIGVQCYRQHVSFDNVTSAGEVIANTGLSILKNCSTKDAEYIYRDLKEMLIDLGYYTQAEFDQLDVKLKWFIPRYNPKQWPQNDASDLTFAAVLNPIDKEAEEKETEEKEAQEKETEENNSSSETENSSSSNNNSDDNQSKNVSSLTKYSKDKGFREGLPVVAPGACTVVEVDEDSIEIEFDGVAQPSISAMHKYRMTIIGVVPAEEAEVGKFFEEGDEIARTGTTQIKVFLKNDIGRILSNVSDYMAPKKADVPELAYFYFLPFESGGKPGTVGGQNGNEVAVGLCQWTALGAMNNISPLCSYLYDQDSSLCAPLRTFISWSTQDFVNDYYGGNSQLVKAFEKVQETDIEKFRTMQLEYALQEKIVLTSQIGCDWIMERNPVTVGTFFSVLNYGPYLGWQKVIDPEMSDEEIIWHLLDYACTIPSTVGTLAHRWTTQYVLALDLLNDSTPKDFDLEKFVFGERIYFVYSNGAHMDSIEKDRGVYGK